MKKQLRDDFGALPPLRICGCGGSTQPAGSYAPSAKTSGPNDSHVTVGHHQNLIEKTNKTLVQAFQQKSALNVTMACDTWERSDDSESDKKSDLYRSTGYYVIVKQESRKLSLEQLENRFAAFPKFFDQRSNVFNANFLLEGFYEFTLEHSMSFDQYWSLFEREAEKFHYKELVVVPEDKLAIRVPLSQLPPKMFRGSETKQFAGLYTEDDVIDWCCSSKENLLSCIPSPTDTNAGQFYYCTPRESLAVLHGVSGSAAIRSQESHSTKVITRGQEQVTVVVPVHGPWARKMSMPQRMTPLPHWNFELDPGVCFSGFNLQGLCRSRLQVEPSAQGTYDHAKMPPDVKTSLISDCLFANMVMRCTGNINQLKDFSQFCSRHCSTDGTTPSLDLPTTNTAKEFAQFLQASKKTMSSFLTDQHRKAIPSFTKSKAEFVTFLHNCSQHEKGFVRVAQYISNRMENKMAIKRKELLDCLKAVMSDCGDQMMDPKLDWFASKIIADVETVLPGFAGEITDDSVFLGSGSTQGLMCIQLEGKDEELTEHAKLLRIHEIWRDLLMEQDETGRRAQGWKGQLRDRKGCIVSIKSEAPYSLVHTEQGLCKYWLAVRAGNANRNVAEVNQMLKPYCFPVRAAPWARAVLEVMELVRNAYLKSLEDADEFPQRLDFPVFK